MFQRGCFGLCGETIDSINYYKEKICELEKKVISNVPYIFQ